MIILFDPLSNTQIISMLQWIEPTLQCLEKKGRDLTQSYDKIPYTHRKIQKAMWQLKKATKNFDYTMSAYQLRTVSWSNDSHQTGVVKPVNAIPTYQLTANAL